MTQASADYYRGLRQSQDVPEGYIRLTIQQSGGTGIATEFKLSLVDELPDRLLGLMFRDIVAELRPEGDNDHNAEITP